MATNETVKSSAAMYYQVLAGLLILTGITFAVPFALGNAYSVPAQMFIAVLKAWLIIMYYMHLKGEKLIGTLVMATLAIVAVFFIIVGIDVGNFQFGDVSHITSPQK
jgi:cytochrome c oxidase subunit 4